MYDWELTTAKSNVSTYNKSLSWSYNSRKELKRLIGARSSALVIFDYKLDRRKNYS